MNSFLLLILTRLNFLTSCFSRYVGEMRNGLRHGKGTFYHANGVSIYEGEWSNGAKEGKVLLMISFKGIVSNILLPRGN